MEWTPEQISSYNDDGFLIVRNLLSDAEVADLREAVQVLLHGNDEVDRMHRERERGGAVRQVYLAHRHNPAFQELVRNPKLTDPVRQILEEQVYIFHSKLNVKEAFEGSVWLWHQDYGYWVRDGVQPRIVSTMILLDRATLNNGCLMVLPGSHRGGRLEHEADTTTTSYKQWCIPPEILKKTMREEDIKYITGEPGDALFFDCNLIHGSGHNMSPLPRNTFIIAYNAIDNKPAPVENPRPDWVVSREFELIT
ncbi:MAG: phytanoyl-CoA dioxygenase family protein [Candidatus Omnitrophica bacterium]|nr:phytanoyl-CoA dioxygenase family protein [Candidatus Omnitrophota bacterium]